MKVGFYCGKWVFLVSLFLCVTGCAFEVVKTDLDVRHMPMPESGPHRFYVKEIDDQRELRVDVLSVEKLNATLSQVAPSRFTNRYGSDDIPLRVKVSLTKPDYKDSAFISVFSTLLSFGTAFIFPMSTTGNEIVTVELFPAEQRINELAEPNKISAKRSMCTHIGWPPLNLIFLGDYDYGPYAIGGTQDGFYREIANGVIQAYNRNPKLLQQAHTKRANYFNRQSESISSYNVVRKRFDSIKNEGSFRVQFVGGPPRESDLTTLQERLQLFAIESFRKGNSNILQENLVILNEDYRSIGTSLMLYEFTISLGTVEFLGLNYDNTTLLGNITIKFPNGNPINARKWVTTNLDRLVEEYNISSDTLIEGEYQLTRETMSANGVYTIEFEVVN